VRAEAKFDNPVSKLTATIVLTNVNLNAFIFTLSYVRLFFHIFRRFRPAFYCESY
jgi:hypothetical protein